MKKLMFITLCSCVVSGTVLGSPLTDFEQTKVSIDLSYLPSVDVGNLDGSTRDIDFGITAALNDKWGLQYIRNNFDADPAHTAWTMPGIGDFKGQLDADLTIEQINILYNTQKNTAFFAGYTRGKYDVNVSYSAPVSGSYRSDARNTGGFQIGMIQAVPMRYGLNTYGIVGIGNKLLHAELGISQELSDNLDINLFYKYIRYKDLKLMEGNLTDSYAKGLGFGVTCKF